MLSPQAFWLLLPLYRLSLGSALRSFISSFTQCSICVDTLSYGTGCKVHRADLVLALMEPAVWWQREKIDKNWSQTAVGARKERSDMGAGLAEVTGMT